MIEPAANAQQDAGSATRPATGAGTSQAVSRIIRRHEYRRMPWSNGAGWTSEILRVPAADDWQWRLSIAEVDVAAPFSSLPGIDRELVLLTGNGMRLSFEDGQTCELQPPHDGLRFAGERKLVGEPIDGPSSDFNLMWKRDAIDAELWRRPLTGTVVLFVEPGETWVVHLLAGQGRFADDTGLGGIVAGDTAILASNGEMRGRYALDATGEALVARLRDKREPQSGSSDSG